MKKIAIDWPWIIIVSQLKYVFQKIKNTENTKGRFQIYLVESSKQGGSNDCGLYAKANAFEIFYC